MKRYKVLQAQIDSYNMKQTLEKIEEFIAEKSPHHVITLNAEIIYNAQSDAKLLKNIQQADLITPDGAGVVWAIKKLYHQDIERVTGIDLLQHIFPQAAAKGWKLYFYGGAPGIAEQAAIKIKALYPNIQIVGIDNGYIQNDGQEELQQRIKAAAPDIIAVALGAPKQEYWIRENLDLLDIPVMIGVGGSFDVLSGTVNRAPEIYQKLKVEWLYRLLKEPKRYKRMLVLPKFMKLVRIENKTRGDLDE
ncbi:MAG: WecB/TagA/CpsF family glycosyltransferase [Clostridia bacterium]